MSHRFVALSFAKQTNINDGSSGPGSVARRGYDDSESELLEHERFERLHDHRGAAALSGRVIDRLLIGRVRDMTIPANTNTVTTFNWSWASSAATFADGDQLYFLLHWTGTGSNCNSSGTQYTTLAQPAYFTTATIVPEGVAGLLLLAPALPFGARWW